MTTTNKHSESGTSVPETTFYVPSTRTRNLALPSAFATGVLNVTLLHADGRSEILFISSLSEQEYLSLTQRDNFTPDSYDQQSLKRLSTSIRENLINQLQRARFYKIVVDLVASLSSRSDSGGIRKARE